MTSSAFLILTLALVAAAADWLAVHRADKRLEYLCKPLTMVLLIAAALALDPADDAVRAWFVVALVLCLIGDVFLMLPQDRFVAGLSAFLLGHLAYIVGMQVDGVVGGRFLVGSIIVLLAVIAIGIPIVRGIRDSPAPELAAPVVAYMLVISTMVASAIGLGGPAVILGALLFYASDALIAWNRFQQATPHAGVTIMVTYHLAQVLLVVSLV